MLIVIGQIHIVDADVAAFLFEMATFGDAARARDGCLFFAVAPENSSAGRILVVERWRDQAALDAHLAAEDTAAFVARWGSRMESDVAKFDAANERELMGP
ncbi:putative quinol monooxygenase [Jiella pacifica]|uniref:Antibiotic biosynthesis monooxygenase n=1 Tax=Jiella pacifica TaxID=2696469 RepID=A0A6N9TBR2_9HYPH|nr:putative quinol monooxygenase [Jiella pacifica]NDW08012.1 antibiotic biosynthesis monooxygenase [Jiella pacifica]